MSIKFEINDRPPFIVNKDGHSMFVSSIIGQLLIDLQEENYKLRKQVKGKQVKSAAPAKPSK